MSDPDVTDIMWDEILYRLWCRPYDAYKRILSDSVFNTLPRAPFLGQNWVRDTNCVLWARKTCDEQWSGLLLVCTRAKNPPNIGAALPSARDLTQAWLAPHPIWRKLQTSSKLFWDGSKDWKEEQASSFIQKVNRAQVFCQESHVGKILALVRSRWLALSREDERQSVNPSLKKFIATAVLGDVFFSRAFSRFSEMWGGQTMWKWWMMARLQRQARHESEEVVARV